MADSEEPVERRFIPDKAKFATQEKLSFFVMLIVSAVIAVICFKGDLSSVEKIYNSFLPFVTLVLGFWIGKSALDSNQQKGSQ